LAAPYLGLGGDKIAQPGSKFCYAQVLAGLLRGNIALLSERGLFYISIVIVCTQCAVAVKFRLLSLYWILVKSKGTPFSQKDTSKYAFINNNKK